MNLRSGRLIVGLCLALAAILWVGFRFDLGSFGSNVMAELAGLVASIAAAVLVVERLVDRDRRARWRLVEAQTMKTLRFALVKGALPLYFHLPSGRPADADPFTMNRAGRLGEALRNLASALREHEDESVKPQPLRVTLDSVAPHINFIRDSVMQRLLTIGAEPKLIRQLALLESTFEDLDFAAWLEDDLRLGSRPTENSRRMADLADSMLGVVAYLD